MKTLIPSLILLAVFIFGLAHITNAETEIFFQESINNSVTYRHTMNIGDNYSNVWEEFQNGNPEFGFEVTSIEYNHSVEGIIPPLLPDGYVRTVSLKIFVRKAPESMVEMTVDTIDFENVRSRKFLIGPEAADSLLVTNSTLKNGKVQVSIVSEGKKNNTLPFIIEKSILTVRYSPAVMTDVPKSETKLPNNIELSQNYPNPFNPSTTIEFALTERSHVKIEIINVRGQVIRSLLNDQRSAGAHTVEWNGRDYRGNLVASGVYFYKIKAGDHINANKMIMLK